MPYARGDVLAAVHREGEVVEQEAGERRPVQVAPRRVRARARVLAECRSWRRPDRPRPPGSSPPPYPYDRLATLEEQAAASRAAMVDCSVGTPCDPPPRASSRPWPPRAASAATRRRPVSLVLRAAGRLDRRRFGVVARIPTPSGACVGTKEFVASVAQYLHLRTPSAIWSSTRRSRTRPTRWAPRSAGLPGGPGARAAGRRARPGSIAGRRRPGSGCCGRTARPTRPAAWPTWRGRKWGRVHGVPVLSDECYAEFTWDGARARS